MFTQEPPEGFPLVHLDHPERPWAGLSEENLRKWTENPGAVIGFIFNGQLAAVGETSANGTRVRSAVKAFLGIPDVSVVLAEAPRDPQRFDAKNICTHPPRPSFILPYLAPEQAHMLWRVRALSMDGTALLFFPPHMRFNDYVSQVVGFAHNRKDQARKIVRQKLWTDSVRDLFLKYLRNNAFRNKENLEIALQRIYESLHLELVPREDDEVHFDFYVDTPAGSIPEWEEWLAAMLDIEWTAPKLINGTGVIKRYNACQGCASVSHEPMDCLFTKIEGWRSDKDLHTRPSRVTGPSYARNNFNGRAGGPGPRTRTNYGRN